MGKHGSEYARIERNHYPTPNRVIAALAEHVDLNGLLVWEPAAGNGGMVEALRCAGCARVYASDIVDYGNGRDKVLDFLSVQMPKLARAPDLICTNPPFDRGKPRAFVEVGLRRLGKHGLLALLLPCDFDSAKSRALLRRLPVLRWQDRVATKRGLVRTRRRGSRGAAEKYSVVPVAEKLAARVPGAGDSLRTGQRCARAAPICNAWQRCARRPGKIRTAALNVEWRARSVNLSSANSTFRTFGKERPSRNPGHHTGARSNYDHEEVESSRS